MFNVLSLTIFPWNETFYLPKIFLFKLKGSPGYLMTAPPSPSCNGNGDVFFNFNDLRNTQTDDFYGSLRTPRRNRSHSLTIPSTRWVEEENHFRLFEITISLISRVRLSSQGHEMTDDEDDSTDEHHSEPSNLLPERYNYMSFRENMQEFPGRVPTRKRKKDPENPQHDSNKPKVRRENNFLFDFKTQ